MRPVSPGSPLLPWHTFPLVFRSSFCFTEEVEVATLWLTKFQPILPWHHNSSADREYLSGVYVSVHWAAHKSSCRTTSKLSLQLLSDSLTCCHRWKGVHHSISKTRCCANNPLSIIVEHAGVQLLLKVTKKRGLGGTLNTNGEENSSSVWNCMHLSHVPLTALHSRRPTHLSAAGSRTQFLQWCNPKEYVLKGPALTPQHQYTNHSEWSGT